MRLAIDTSAHLCAACIYDSNNTNVLASETRDIGRGHAEILMDVIADCMKAADASFEQISEVYVTVGPGSFTGVRVGLAAARGFGLSLSVPVIGISTLESCAEYARQHDAKTPLATLIDAKRGEAYCQIDQSSPFIAAYEALVDEVPANANLCGSGAAIFNEKAGLKLPILHHEAVAPIEVIAAMTFSTDSHPPEPLYLRSADAKPQAGFVLPRAL